MRYSYTMRTINRLICWFFGHTPGVIHCRIEGVHKRYHQFACRRCLETVAEIDGEQFVIGK